ncbi:MAG: Holliday junction branch migration protein RuvA [Epsilonproteobacteria bacterium]|jgi:Holliday junction DNA helicase RuvA|nr:Holliday junction branch migration protein RuvA [Campylobacterota bacterium]NPA89419.1 Holliday junction branch migration protein RuvA [Campylobacterota bacterium]
MIGGLKGQIFEKWEGKFLVNVGGILFEVYVPAGTFSQREGEILLYIYEAVREGEVTLYGFETRQELEFFRELIRVGGVGSKTALAILSTYPPPQLVELLRSGDLKGLTRVPGVGPKTARRILAEMGDFVEKIEVEGGEVDQTRAQAISALEGLGFPRQEVVRVLTGVSGSLEEMVKEGLKRLSKGVR